MYFKVNFYKKNLKFREMGIPQLGSIPRPEHEFRCLAQNSACREKLLDLLIKAK